MVPRLERVLDRLNRIYGSGKHYNRWSTEVYRGPSPRTPVGTSCQPGPMPRPSTVYKQRRISSFDQYLLVQHRRRQLRQWPDDQRARPQAVVQRLRAMSIWLPTTSTRKGKQVKLWGSARPAHFAKGTQKVHPLQQRQQGQPRR